MSLFENRKIAIATMHQKERVITPILEKHFQIKCFVPSELNTDSLGTFSGEIERKADPLSTLRQKCLLALETSATDLVIANEGSFGAHPSLFFTLANNELVMLLDTKNELEIVASELSLETNFAAKEIETYSELEEFAKKSLFPSHGLIIKNSQTDFTEIVKGINDWYTLKSVFETFKSKYGKVYVETDMRAMYNPTRLKNIEKATIKLIEKMKSICPKCESPGFDTSDFIAGLPCENCGKPTNSTLKKIMACNKCKYKLEIVFPYGEKEESPEFCNNCNP